MANRALVLAVVALGLLGCLSGCTSAIAGLPVPGASPVASAMSANKELGDFDTIEPCGLVDVAGLPKDMQAEVEPQDTLDACSLRVDSAGAAIQLDVGSLVYDEDDVDETKPQALPSGLALYTGSVQQQSCTAYLKFAEGIEMTSVAYANDGDGTANLCTAATTVARDVSGVLAKGPVPHRAFPPNSLATVDPCPLLTDDILLPVGLTALDHTSYPAHHECDWAGGKDDDEISAYLSFIVGPPPVAQPNVSTAVTIAGRPSIMVSTTDDSAAECWIDTAGQTFGTQQNLVEIAEIYISDADQSTDTACQVGTTLATSAWPKLPPAP
ncbi:MAG TPA: hypothetical protein VHZ97_01640 [Pseudonocardiaceae bacterium]|nr:hypothetical protein [Pseudonocardiaceae bacterium]